MSDDGRRGRAMAAIGAATAVGWPVAAAVLIGVFADRSLGTEPWLTLGLTLGAFAGAVRRLIATVSGSDDEQP